MEKIIESKELLENPNEAAEVEKNEEIKEDRPVVTGILDIQEENSFGFLRFDNFLTLFAWRK